MNIILTIFLFLFPVFLLFVRRGRPSKRVPPGSLGLPIIGQSLGMLRAMRTNTAEKWLEERVQKYGPISKLSLFGKPTVFIYGQAANKFIFTSDGSVLSNQQTRSVKMILGERCLLELNGEDHKRVRDALVSFLKPDFLKRYVGKMEEEVRIHLETYFDIICSLLFGLESGARRDQLVQYFQWMIEGMWSIPINFPFTRFNRSLKASKDVQKMLKQLIREKQYEFENNLASSHQDLITCLLSIRGENNQQLISGESLTWEDLGKMKYTSFLKDGK